MQLTPLSPFGAEISDVDISQPTAGEREALEATFAEHGLLVIRDQDLDEDDHIRFARRFGDIVVNRFFAANQRHPEIAMVTKEPDDTANIGGGWHTDQSYDEAPATGSILVARELPTSGGDTWFVSMYRAFDALSEGLRDTLLGLRAVHSARHVFGSAALAKRQARNRLGNARQADELAEVVHPAVIAHPLSGKPALFVNPRFTVRFEGWSEAESRGLLEHLYAVASHEDQIYRLRWRPGTVAFWDNRATWHYACNDYPGQRREMHRITIAGCPLTAAREPVPGVRA